MASTKKSRRVREFAFDIKLYAVVRVHALDKESALRAAELAIDCVSLSEVLLDDPNVKVTEASLHVDDVAPLLFEVDGEEVYD